MRGGTNLISQFLLGPVELLRRPQIPGTFFHRQLCLQNDYILCPANPHGLLCQSGIIFVSAEELPHPAQVTGGETRGFRVCGLQML